MEKGQCRVSDLPAHSRSTEFIVLASSALSLPEVALNQPSRVLEQRTVPVTFRGVWPRKKETSIMTVTICQNLVTPGPHEVPEVQYILSSLQKLFENGLLILQMRITEVWRSREAPFVCTADNWEADFIQRSLPSLSRPNPKGKRKVASSSPPLHVTCSPSAE